MFTICCCCLVPIFSQLYFLYDENKKNRNKMGDFFATIKFHTIKSTIFSRCNFGAAHKKSRLLYTQQFVQRLYTFLSKMLKKYRSFFKMLCCSCECIFISKDISKFKFINNSIHIDWNVLKTPLLSLLSFEKCFHYQ